MKKLKYLMFCFLAVILLFGCSSDKDLEISASITSLTSTSESITFYATIKSNQIVEAHVVLENGNSIVEEFKDVVLNQTKEYSFLNLEADKTYSVSIKYSKNSKDYITIAREEIQTKSNSKTDITIECEDLDVVYDGTAKTLNALSSIKELPLVYNYSLNGNKVEQAVEAGKYEVVISFLGNEEYSPCSITKILNIKKADITIDCEDMVTIYDGTAKILEATSNVEGVTLTYDYLLNGKKVEQAVEAGEYEVVINFAGNKNYNSCSVTRRLVIKKADVLLSCEDVVVEYDGSVKGVNASCNVANLVLTYQYYLNDVLIENPKNAGTYQVVIAFAGNKNYNSAQIEKTLLIQPQPVNIDYTDFTVKYGEDYKIEVAIIQSYKVEYFQGETVLPDKPHLPGEYSANITITDSNYSGLKKVYFVIDKVDYKVSYKNCYLLLGQDLVFELDDFVQIKYYFANEEVDNFSLLGEYIVHFKFQNHSIYNDLDYIIIVTVDDKKHILLEEDEFYIECVEDYNVLYHLNYDVDVNIEYYLENQQMNKPMVPGKYDIKFWFAGTEEYAVFEKVCKLILYPSLNEIKNVDEGIFHTKGMVIAKDEYYSYLVDDGYILCVKDLTLVVGESYEIIGDVQYFEEKFVMTLYKQNKILNIEQQNPRTVSLLDYKDKMDDYKNLYIALRGLVVEINQKSYLVLEDDFAFPLNGKYNMYLETHLPLEINIISFGENYILISDKKAILDRREELYAMAYLYTFPELTSKLPTSIEPLGIHIEYLETSNQEVIDILTLKVMPQEMDVKVTLKVKLTLDEYVLEKNYQAIILKQVEKELNIYSIEMHQQYGDSILITYGDFEILIDAGDTKDGPYVNAFLKEHISSDNHLDMIIVSHCHSDHMGGLAYGANESSSKVKALDGIASIGTIIDYGHDRSTNALHKSWVEIRNKYIAEGASYYPVYDAAKNLNGAKSHYDIDDKLSLDFLDTNTYLESTKDVTSSSAKFNIYSVAALLTYDNFKFFFAGDLEDAGERNLLNNISNTPLKDITEDNIVLYKAAHHGTDPGTNNGGAQGGNQLPFLKALKPDYFFASAAMCNGGGGFIGGQPHPYPRCLANFYYFNDNVYFNGTNGTLEFITNGQEMKSIHGLGATTSYLVDGSTIDYSSQADLKLIDTLWYKKYRKDAVDEALATLA